MANEAADGPESKYDSPPIGHRNALVRAIHRGRYCAVVRTIGALKPESVLDFGSGTGSLVIQLLKGDHMPPVIAACEPGDRRNATDLAAKLSRVRGRAIDVYFDLDQTDAHFEFICSTGVFEHLPLKQRLEAYRLIREHLTPGGRVLIQVPIMIGVGLVIRECVRVAVKNKRFLYGPGELFGIGLLAGRATKEWAPLRPRLPGPHDLLPSRFRSPPAGRRDRPERLRRGPPFHRALRPSGLCGPLLLHRVPGGGAMLTRWRDTLARPEPSCAG